MAKADYSQKGGREAHFMMLLIWDNAWVINESFNFKTDQKRKNDYTEIGNFFYNCHCPIIEDDLVTKEVILKVSHLKKSFYSDFWKPRVNVLKDVSFEVYHGEAVGFLGANGAGKTTTLKIILGLIRQDEGEIYFNESLGQTREERIAKIGYLPERPYFYPHLSGRQYCHFVSKLENLRAQEFRQNLEQLAGEFSMGHSLDKKLSSYSKGMLQRIGLIAALLQSPKLVFLDEPMSGLDPLGRREIKQAIEKLKKKGVTVFFSTHIVSDVEELCDSVVVLKEGQCLFNGPIHEMIEANSETSVTLSYIKDGRLSRKEVAPQEVNEQLAELIKCGAQVKSVVNNHPRLEEVIYQIQDRSR